MINKNFKLNDFTYKIYSSGYKLFLKILFSANDKKNKISSRYYENTISSCKKSLFKADTTINHTKHVVFIMKKIIKNFKISVQFKKYNNCGGKNIIIYIISIEDLFTITNSDKIFLCFLHDILVKLKLNAEITIIDADNINITKLIKIGYINNKSKIYNKDLKVYIDSIEKLVYIIIILMIYPNNNYPCRYIERRLIEFFINL